MSKATTVIEFPKEYIVLDTETTGLEADYDQIIEIAMLKICNDEIVDSFSSVVRPTQSYDYPHSLDLTQEEAAEYIKTHLIPSFITELTGITNEMVLSAPLFSEIADNIRDFIGDLPIVGHNVPFDNRFLNYAYIKNNQPQIENRIICTMRISRKFLPNLEHHRLSDVCQALGIEQDTVHRAFGDAKSTFAVFSKIHKELDSKGEIESFIHSFAKKVVGYDKFIETLKPTVNEFDETNPLFGKVVVFTGALSSMSRKQAFQVVVDHGGIPSNSLTQKTNFLVIGNEEFADSVKNGKTNKMKKAESFQSKGKDISVVSENTFFDVLVE